MLFEQKRTARDRKLLQFQLLVYNNKVRGVIPFQSGHTTSPLFSFNLVWELSCPTLGWYPPNSDVKCFFSWVIFFPKQIRSTTRCGLPSKVRMILLSKSLNMSWIKSPSFFLSSSLVYWKSPANANVNVIHCLCIFCLVSVFVFV